MWQNKQNKQTTLLDSRLADFQITQIPQYRFVWLIPVYFIPYLSFSFLWKEDVSMME
jgi:hypothetical protein